MSTTVAVVEPAATFHNVDETDRVQIEIGDEVVLTGETNVAPGSDAMVRLSDAGKTASFLINTDAEIEADGHLETDPVDVSERTADDETSIQLRVGTEPITVADGIFVDVLEGRTTSRLKATTNRSRVTTNQRRAMTNPLRRTTNRLKATTNRPRPTTASPDSALRLRSLRCSRPRCWCCDDSRTVQETQQG